MFYETYFYSKWRKQPASRALLLATAGATQAQTTTYTFTAPGGPQTYTVPAGVTRLQVVAVGGSGGNYSGIQAQGAQVTATVAVTPGELLTVVGGGQAVSGLNVAGPGGYNGSGGSYTAGGGGGGFGGGGGGSSFVATGGSSIGYSVATTAGNGLLTLTPLYAPTITNFSPMSAAMGSQLLINGTNLSGATSVRFGELPARQSTVSVNAAGTQLTMTVPVLAAPTAVSVTTPGGVAVSPTRFQVTRASSSLTYTQVANLQSGYARRGLEVEKEKGRLASNAG